MKSKTVSIVMPAYQNEAHIEKIVRDYYNEIIKKIPGSEFIVTEDGSADRTREILKRLEKELKLNFILSRERKGYIKAVKEGFEIASKDIIFLSDSDGEHNPKDFWILYNEMEKTNADIVVGAKQKRRPLYRLFISRVENFIIGMLFGVWLHDANCGFRLAKKEAAKDIMPNTGTLKSAFNAEFIIRAKNKGYSYVEVPVSHKPVPSKVFSPWKMPVVILKELKRMLTLKKSIFAKCRKFLL